MFAEKGLGTNPTNAIKGKESQINNSFYKKLNLAKLNDLIIGVVEANPMKNKFY